MTIKVEQLSNVLNIVFSYKVSSVSLSTRVKKLPQVQVHKHIADFIEREDGPAPLLIVYYAGQEVPTGILGHLELSRSVKNAYFTRTRLINAVCEALQSTIRTPSCGTLRRPTWRIQELTSSRFSLVAILVTWE